MTIAELRMSKDMSLGELARAVNLGSAMMSRIERGRENPPDAVIADIARVLECTPQEVRSAIPTAEEVAEKDAKLASSMVAVAAVWKDAKSHGFGEGNGGQGEIACPVCKGRLLYSVAAVNGHIWGKCNTPGCVAWMQ